MIKYKSIQESFEKKFERVPWSGCWIWTSSTNPRASSPQSLFYFSGKKKIASRVAYELYVGPIPEDQIVRHICDNSLCVNPNHLELGTQYDNMQDRINRGRWKGGRPRKERD